MATLDKTFEIKHLIKMQTGYNDISRLLRINAGLIAKDISRLQYMRSLHPSKYGSQLLRNKKLQKQIAKRFFELEENIDKKLNNLTKEQWGLANEKNTLLTKNYIGHVPIEYAHLNIDALKAFQARNIKGLNISNRIHNVTELNQQLYKDYIGTGITQGKSSIKIARELNKINADPYNVTVFDKEGNPTRLGRISKILKQNVKGRGIYRSPLKNLFRLTRTETNAAYRLSDYTRIQQLDFVVGYIVHLSASHNIWDMCDGMKGRYPKTFKFYGWHPNCICYVTTILKTKKEFREGLKSKNLVKRIPRRAQRYVKSKDMSYYDWHKNNFTKKNIPFKKVGGPSPGIEPYKISVDSKDYKPRKKILRSATKIR